MADLICTVTIVFAKTINEKLKPAEINLEEASEPYFEEFLKCPSMFE